LASCRLRAELDGVLAAAAMSPPPGLRARLRAEVERSFRPPWWRRALAPLRAPVPAYGLAIASLVPPLTLAAVRLWSPPGDGAAAADRRRRRQRAARAAAQPPVTRPLPSEVTCMKAHVRPALFTALAALACARETCDAPEREDVAAPADPAAPAREAARAAPA